MKTVQRWWQYQATPWLSNRYDKLCIFLVWHCMPHRLVNWAAVRLMAFGTVGKYSSQIVPELTCIEALGRWNGNDMRKSESEHGRRY